MANTVNDPASITKMPPHNLLNATYSLSQSQDKDAMGNRQNIFSLQTSFQRLDQRRKSAIVNDFVTHDRAAPV
jgi:hypothetical protein